MKTERTDMCGNDHTGNFPELRLELQDSEWPLTYTDHDRQIVRGIVTDDGGCFRFVRVDRDDEFGCARLIETSGGGVEEGEDLAEALKRELREELGAEVEILCRIGTVSDYYNLIHRHNLNNYYLCRLTGTGSTHLTEDERNVFHLTALRLTYEEALGEYERCACTKLGRLIAAREMPALRRAKENLNEMEKEKAIDMVMTFAGQAGFKAARFDASALEPKQEVRSYCVQDKCNRYNASWSCPPACGSLEEMKDRMSRYSTGILLMTVIETGGHYDPGTIRHGADHKERFDALVRQTRTLFPDCLPMGAGSCTRCAECTYPDAPCRFPDELYYSMEASGLMVKDVCDLSGMPYYWGPDRVCFFSCILIN